MNRGAKWEWSRREEAHTSVRPETGKHQGMSPRHAREADGSAISTDERKLPKHWQEGHAPRRFTAKGSPSPQPSQEQVFYGDFRVYASGRPTHRIGPQLDASAEFHVAHRVARPKDQEAARMGQPIDGQENGDDAAPMADSTRTFAAGWAAFRAGGAVELPRAAAPHHAEGRLAGRASELSLHR